MLIKYHSRSVVEFLIKLARPCHHTFSSLLLLVSSDRVLPLDGPKVEILLFRPSNSIIDVCMHIYSELYMLNLQRVMLYPSLTRARYNIKLTNTTGDK